MSYELIATSWSYGVGYYANDQYVIRDETGEIGSVSVFGSSTHVSVWVGNTIHYNFIPSRLTKREIIECIGRMTNRRNKKCPMQN